MNYYELVQLADKVNNELDYIIEILKQDIQGESVELSISKLREIMINAEFLKDKLLQLNINDVIIAAEEVEEND